MRKTFIQKFVAFLYQRYGDREGMDGAIVGKRRLQYGDEVKKNHLNYDNWFDYIRLEESVAIKDRISEVYERGCCQCSSSRGKALLATLHILMDQLRPVRRA